MTDSRLVETSRLAVLGRLTPGALHELANPLLALAGTVQLLLDDAYPASRAYERLTLVKSTADEVSDTIRLLQRLARERLEPEQPLELGPFALETLDIVLRLAGPRDIEVESRAEGDAVIAARPADLRQVLAALVLDALDGARPGGSVEVRVAGPEVRVSPAAPARDVVLDAVVEALGGHLAADAGSARLTLPAT